MSVPYASSSREPLSPLNFGNPFVNENHLKQMQPRPQDPADSPYMEQLRKAAEGAKERQLQQALAAVNSLGADNAQLQGTLKTTTIAHGLLQEQIQTLEKRAQERKSLYRAEKTTLQEMVLASTREAKVLGALLKDRTEADNISALFKGSKEAQLEATGREMILCNQRLVKQVEQSNIQFEELMISTNRAQLTQKQQQYAEKKQAFQELCSWINQEEFKSQEDLVKASKSIENLLFSNANDSSFARLVLFIQKELKIFDEEKIAVLPVLSEWIEEVETYCQLRSTPFAYDQMGTILTDIKKINNNLKSILIGLFSSNVVLDSLFEKYNEALSNIKGQVELALRRKHLILHEQYVTDSKEILDNFIAKCEEKEPWDHLIVPHKTYLNKAAEKMKDYHRVASQHFLDNPYLPDQDYIYTKSLLKNPIFKPKIQIYHKFSWSFEKADPQCYTLPFTPLILDQTIQEGVLQRFNAMTKRLGKEVFPSFLCFAERAGIGKLTFSLRPTSDLRKDLNMIKTIQFFIEIDFDLLNGETIRIGRICGQGNAVFKGSVGMHPDVVWNYYHAFDFMDILDNAHRNEMRYIESCEPAALEKIKYLLDEKLLEDNKTLCAELIQDPLFRKSLNEVSFFHEIIKDYTELGGCFSFQIEKWEALNLNSRIDSYLKATPDSKPLFPFNIELKDSLLCSKNFSRSISSFSQDNSSPIQHKLNRSGLKINQIETKWKELSRAGKLIEPHSLEQRKIEQLTQELEMTKSKNQALEERLAIIETFMNNLINKNSPQGN